MTLKLAMYKRCRMLHIKSNNDPKFELDFQNHLKILRIVKQPKSF